jgi:hypothetical protein
MLSHKESVFMCDNDDDLDAEISGLFRYDPDNIEAIEEAANNYWNGVPHHSESFWEYLTPSAKIVKVEKF